MPLFLIERNFAEQLELTPEGAAAVQLVNADVGVNWLFSFLTADKRKTYCLYEAADESALREAARRANIPADVIIAVSRFGPELALQPQAFAQGGGQN
jgi:Protein of unknown function (DUF4242)